MLTSCSTCPAGTLPELLTDRARLSKIPQFISENRYVRVVAVGVAQHLLPR